jgi:hypothetical protein
MNPDFFRVPMPQPPTDPIRKFQATFITLAEATAFLRRFMRKFGYLDGRGYSVSGTGTNNAPVTGPITAFVSFSPWHHEISSRDRTDFKRLLTDANATEISTGA